MIRYIWEVSDIRLDDLRDAVIAAAGEEMKDTMITTADRLRQEGRLEGERHGRLEGERHGRIELLVRLLTARFGEVSPDVRQRCETITIEQLDRWAERTLTARSIEEVLAS